MHVDAESCTYWRASSRVDAERWTSIVQNENSSGNLIDIKVLLPDEDTSWEVSVSRTIRQEYVDISGLPSEKVSRDDVSEESLAAFDMCYSIPNSDVCVLLFWLVHFDDQVRRPMNSTFSKRILQLWSTELLITLKPGECSNTTKTHLRRSQLCFGLDVEHEFQGTVVSLILKIPKVAPLLKKKRANLCLTHHPQLTPAHGLGVTANSRTSKAHDAQKLRIACFGFHSRRQKYLPQRQRMTNLKVSTYTWTVSFFLVFLGLARKTSP